MKQSKWLLFFISICLVIVSACSKEKKNIGLKSDDAEFITTKDGEIIRFTEEEDFDISKEIAARFGLSELTIKRGLYEIRTSKNEYGTVVLQIKSYKELKRDELKKEVLNKTGFDSEGSDIGIRIAKRKKLTCGGEPVSTPCICGIGFRCGTTNYIDELELNEKIYSENGSSINAKFFPADRIKRANFSINKDNLTLKISFIERVNWRQLNN